MGMMVTSQQNLAAVDEAVTALVERFGGMGVEASSVERNTGKHPRFVRIISTPRQWLGLAKFLRFDLGINYCSMITGTHFPQECCKIGSRALLRLHIHPSLCTTWALASAPISGRWGLQISSR